MKITIEFDSYEEMLSFKKNDFAESSIIANYKNDMLIDDLLPDQIDGHERAKNCLKSHLIYKIGDLMAKTERQLLEMPNLGRKSLAVIKRGLEKEGLFLKQF